ncbi:MAG: 16S rRNA (adenine(1518)-N(6)/adenine(1519)-N(6))-dimethyltransferase RsmA [Firmicutes bacterium]|nr:16S rRNA (adenine(1518)-N(6)/adenine(1519)-N(6))-dimethyltransferase RsmA [Bacillota bacterium]
MILKKSRGQHLLTDKNMMRKIADAADLNKENNVMEIGPGTGLLTELLVQKAGKVTAFEVDRSFTEKLTELEKTYSNLKVIYGDFLKTDLAAFLSDFEDIKVVANIPYNITTPILEKLLIEGGGKITSAFLLMQEEVARRIVAPPGNKEYGRLSVFIQYFCDASVLFTVPPSVFVPPPKVNSAVLKLVFRKDKLSPEEAPFRKLMFKIVETAFSQRRKQAGKLLMNMGGQKPEIVEAAMKESGIDMTRRAETISVEEYVKLAQNIIKLQKQNLSE